MLLKKINSNPIWVFFNQPLTVTIIIALITFFLFLSFGQKEKVRCDIMLHLNEDYLKNEWNLTEDMLELFKKRYSSPFEANLTFDNYQEALSFKYLWIDGQKHDEWYIPTLNCDGYKIELPLKPKEILNR